MSVADIHRMFDEAELVAPDLPPVEAYENDVPPRPKSSLVPAKPKAPPPLALLWYATLDGVKQQDQLVKGLLLAGSLFVVYGDSGSGKTFFVLDLALAIAAGILWRGRRTQKGLVVYVAGEGAASVRARVAAYRLTHPELSTLPFAIVAQAVDFLSIESVAQLVETIRAAEVEIGERAVLVIIDTFARAMSGGDENSAQDVGAAVTNADYVRAATGAAVGFIHHAGKDPAKGARGSSALRAATDTEILIEGQSGPRNVSVTKQRDLECGASMSFELMPVTIGEDPDDGSAITSCTVRHMDAPAMAAPAAVQLRGKAQRQLLAALRARSKDQPSQIWTLFDLRHLGKELGMGKSTAKYAVDAIVTLPYFQASVGGYLFTDGEPKQ